MNYKETDPLFTRICKNKISILSKLLSDGNSKLSGIMYIILCFKNCQQNVNAQ